MTAANGVNAPFRRISSQHVDMNMRLPDLLVACAALGGLLFSLPAAAADLSVQQVRAQLAEAAQQSRPADFSGRDLSDLDLSGLDFRRARISGASLFGSRLVEADFRDADLRGTNLNGAWLMGTDFSGANLSGASLLSVVVLGGTVKKMPVFRQANLSGVKMIADLPGADLSGADFSRAMVGVNIKNQGMGQMRTDLSNARLSKASLAGADFNRSLMSYCDLSGSNLRGANFFRVKLSGADLTGADVTGADFTEADLEGTVFRQVTGFAEAKGIDRAENADKILR